jgi:predicted dehydrogenase
MVPTRVLVVGMVRGAAVARDLNRAADFDLVGIVDLDEEKLARVGDELGVPNEARYARTNATYATTGQASRPRWPRASRCRAVSR